MKTAIELRELIAEVNKLNKGSTCEKSIRTGWNALLTALLTERNVYDGFRYLEESEVPDGCDPGIFAKGNSELLLDETRRFFNTHPALRGKHDTRSS